jgi:hypothetical protein
MKPWNPTFDASSERLDIIPIWVYLLGLPPHLWTERCFKALRNFLGDYISADMSFLFSGNMTIARILVSLNIKEGLREFINLTNLGRTRVQILDYEGVPFHCRHCHEYGHVVKYCSKPFSRRHDHNPLEDRCHR